jgi:hypothetical protein
MYSVSTPGRTGIMEIPTKTLLDDLALIAEEQRCL